MIRKKRVNQTSAKEREGERKRDETTRWQREKSRKPSGDRETTVRVNQRDQHIDRQADRKTNRQTARQALYRKGKRLREKTVK